MRSVQPLRRAVFTLSSVAVAVGAAGCLSVLNGVAYDPLPDALVVERRPEGCVVEIVEDGAFASRRHARVGHVRLDWSRAKMEAQGHEGALKSLREEACARGAHLILDLRVMPKTPDPGSFYDADFAVLLDEAGQPLQARSFGSSSSAGPAASGTPASSAAPPSSAGAPLAPPAPGGR